MPSLNLWRAFNAVAEYKSMSKASEKLFVSQPAISNALKKLQAEIGVSLFKKSGRGLVMTEQGDAIYELVRRMFDTEKEIERLVASLSAHETPSIHIGLATLYERFAVEDILFDFAKINKNISITIHSGNSATIAEKMDDKSLDLGIAGNIIKNNKLLFAPYREHEVFLVAPKGHKLYGKTTFTASDINGEKVVLKERGSAARFSVDNFIIRNNIQLMSIVELSNIDTILNLVTIEKCIAFLPDLSICGLAKERFSAAQFKGEEKIFFSTYVITYPLSEYTRSKRQIVEAFLELVRGKNALNKGPGHRQQHTRPERRSVYAHQQ